MKVHSRANQAEGSTVRCGCGGGGDAEDVVDLVDDHVPDGVDQQVLQQPPVHHQLPALLTGLGGLNNNNIKSIISTMPRTRHSLIVLKASFCSFV